jgi:hypothetical protein
MSGLLNTISEDFSRRIAVRRQMMAHLGLAPTDSQCIEHRTPLRDTLVACTRCPEPEVCAAWVAQGRPGSPVFCRARETFLRLEAALAPPPEIRRSA